MKRMFGLGLGIFALVLAGQTGLAAERHCHLGGDHRFIEDPGTPNARAVCLREGKILCQLDGAVDPWCQAREGAGSVSVECAALTETLRCCTGTAGSGLPPENAQCHQATW